MAHSETNWQAAKQSYVEGHKPPGDAPQVWPTLEQVGAQFGISPNTMRKVAGREAWTDERQLYRQKLAQARQEKRTDVLAAMGAQFDSRALKAAEAIIQQVVYKLAASAQAKLPLPSVELSRLSTTLANAIKTGHLAMGDTTEIQKLVGTVTHEFDLSSLDNAELAQWEGLLRKMQGLSPAAPGVH